MALYGLGARALLVASALITVGCQSVYPQEPRTHTSVRLSGKVCVSLGDSEAILFLRDQSSFEDSLTLNCDSIRPLTRVEIVLADGTVLDSTISGPDGSISLLVPSGAQDTIRLRARPADRIYSPIDLPFSVDQLSGEPQDDTEWWLVVALREALITPARPSQPERE